MTKAELERRICLQIRADLRNENKIDAGCDYDRHIGFLLQFAPDYIKDQITSGRTLTVEYEPEPRTRPESGSVQDKLF